MPTKREAILSALFARLAADLSVQVERNHVDPERIPAGGIVIQRDGDPGDPVEVTLSPLTYEFEHRVELEVTFIGEGDADRIAGLDALVAEIGQSIAGDRTLGGLCDWIETAAPQPDDLPLEGAETLKTAFVPLILHYWTSDPLA